MRGYSLFTSWHRDGSITHHVELWTQPTWRYLLAKVYHWYDMWVCRCPLYPLMSRVSDWRHRRRDVLSYLPLAAAQDVRCYELSRRKRQVLARLDLPDGVYATVRSGGDSDGGPYGDNA